MKSHPAYAAYRLATRALSPFMPHLLKRRMAIGKEDPERLPERLGQALLLRPRGTLAWLHAASVGEANSVLPLVDELRRRYPELRLLLTTGTVTSAKLMGKRLPPGAVHQFIPLDTPQAVGRFLAHWKPDIALWVESELWPNLILQARGSGCRMALINARMSDKSFRIWKLFGSAARTMLDAFSRVFAQSEPDAARFRALGAKSVECVGNLKLDGVPLASDAETLDALARAAADRPRWLAASTHPGEDEWIAETHAELKKKFPGILTVVVPRHPARGLEMRAFYASKNLRVAQRSTDESILPETDLYLADTLGELGLFYRFAPLVAMGGSLIPHGGQNPLEPARLGCTILAGPHMFNFAEAVRGLEQADALRTVPDARSLAPALEQLLADPKTAAGMASRASAWMLGKDGVSERLMDHLAPMIEEAMAHAPRA